MDGCDEGGKKKVGGRSRKSRGSARYKELDEAAGSRGLVTESRRSVEGREEVKGVEMKKLKKEKEKEKEKQRIGMEDGNIGRWGT